MTALILGGSASGKSEYAERLAAQLPGPHFYLATMRVWDAECAARVEKHRCQRAGRGFVTRECPFGLAQSLQKQPIAGTVLLEDLGNLLSNELFDPAGAGNGGQRPEAAAQAVLAGLERLRGQADDLVIVSNEIFSDGGEYPPATADYLRALAGLHRALAQNADAAIEVAAGLPLWHKGKELRRDFA